MALNLPFNIKPVNPTANLDERYGNHATIQDALDATAGTRAIGLTVLVNGVEYWFRDGIADGDLRIKLPVVLAPQGNWNATTNTPDISATTETGYYWIVSVTGSTDIGGITDWVVNDWVVKTSDGWAKIDNTDKVTSVNGETGAINDVAKTDEANVFVDENKFIETIFLETGLQFLNSLNGFFTRLDITPTTVSDKFILLPNTSGTIALIEQITKDFIDALGVDATTLDGIDGVTFLQNITTNASNIVTNEQAIADNGVDIAINKAAIENVQIADENGINKFSLNLFTGEKLKFRNASFNLATKEIIIPVTSYASTYYIDSTLLNSDDAQINNIDNPFHSLQAVFDDLPTDNGKFIRIAFIKLGSTGIVQGCRLQARNIIWENLSDIKLIIDFSAVVTPETLASNAIVDHTGVSGIKFFQCPTGRIVFKTNYDGIQGFCNYLDMVFEGEFGLDWNATNYNLATTGILATNQFCDFVLSEWTTYNRHGGYNLQFSKDSKIVLKSLYVTSSTTKIVIRGYETTSRYECNILNIVMAGKCSIASGFNGFVKISKITGTGEISLPRVEFINAEIAATITLKTNNPIHIKGKIASAVPYLVPYTSNDFIIEDFIGNMNNIALFLNAKVRFIGANEVTYTTSLIDPDSTKITNEGDAIVVENGTTVIHATMPTDNLIDDATEVLTIRNKANLITNCTNLSAKLVKENNVLREITKEEFEALPQYADDAAATADGLASGKLYFNTTDRKFTLNT